MAKTRVQFHEELENLRHRLLRMSGDVDWMLDNAIRSMIEGNLDLAKQVIRADDSVDKLDLEIEAECMSMLALQQPVARDLRLIGSAMKAITDIERIGDYAVDIAKIGRRTTIRNGSKLVAKLVRVNSVQIALRLPSPDLAKAREIAGRKGIGYQTLLKMLVHEGLQRVESKG